MSSFFYLTFSSIYFSGFTSVVVGSDLKWWRINPCETSRDKNMFQNLHKCDPETTMVVIKDILK